MKEENMKERPGEVKLIIMAMAHANRSYLIINKDNVLWTINNNRELLKYEKMAKNKRNKIVKELK